MRIQVGAILPALLLFFGAIVAPPARADIAYSSTSISIASTTEGKAQEIPATLLKPEGAGPFPAIVVAHDCSGLGTRSSGAPLRWAHLLAAEAYVVLVPDSFLPRGYAEGVCFGATPTGALPERDVSIMARAVDAAAALAYLRALPFVDGRHIGIMGGSHGGSTVLAAMVDAANPLASAGMASPRISPPASRSIRAAARALAPGM